MNTQNDGRREEGREGGRKKVVGSEADSFRAVSNNASTLLDFIFCSFFERFILQHSFFDKIDLLALLPQRYIVCPYTLVFLLDIFPYIHTCSFLLMFYLSGECF